MHEQCTVTYLANQYALGWNFAVYRSRLSLYELIETYDPFLDERNTSWQEHCVIWD